MYYVVNRINFPRTEDTFDLYFANSKSGDIDVDWETGKISLAQNEIVSTNSYFNSFYESYYAKYTTLNSLYYLLRLNGDFQVSVYREGYERERELLGQETFKQCQITDGVKIALPALQQSHTLQGRIYLEIQCLSDRGIFVEGAIVTEEQPLRNISLAIISCTFKKEAYIKNTVKTILQDSLLANKSWQIFVVDNGQTVSQDDFNNDKLHLIPNENLGGSGGFTKGMVTALQSECYTHLLLMDDDILLDTEAIYRLFSIYEYAEADFAVAGSMLDLYKKHILYEAGAAYDKDPQSFKFSPFRVAPLKHNLELQKTESLNLLLSEDDVDYGGFWFFAVPSQFVKEIGFLLPFFIKIDDMEFGLRIKRQLSKQIVAFPSIAVWHEPFYSKVIVWDGYYYTRNNLIARTIYGTINYTNTLFKFTKDFIYSLLVFEYNYAEMIVRGFEDYLQGPNLLKKNSPEKLHREIVQLSKSYKTQTLQPNYCLDTQLSPPRTKAKVWQKFLSLLTINGHLLPNFIHSDGEVMLWQNSAHAGTLSRVFRKNKVTIYREENSCLLQNELDKSIGINLIKRWLKILITSTRKWSVINREWKSAAPELTSTSFWQHYLKLKESN
ncbi:MAG: Galactofuranosyltransferase GlfT2 [Chroococcidiopsis sp. SAG 2025]|uniref:glycosyltransferase n=1 Tax=Chroococcidiopsis sp. SAG 2025 TaxID=171389 RepID=UPI00293717A8|nr:glycosyltransferase [Chroococcidiopsis sp. SAG 2025]MDV2996806.1 Galactofuranosyltransferase GlfT2 [Chroococcidiopsis sp. SAG 2025]